MEERRQSSLLRNLYITVLAAVLVLVSAIAYSCAKQEKTAAPADTLPPCALTSALDSLFMPLYGADAPGAIIIVSRADTAVYKRCLGLARLDVPTPVTDSTTFNMASASKIFTAVALLKLAEQGVLSLDDRLSKYFPEFPGEVFDNITIRNILTHSSGLPDLRPRSEDEWKEYLTSHSSVFCSMPDYRLYGTEKEHIQVFKNLKSIEFEPGTHYQRTDPSFILVAPLIQRAMGISFEKYMRDSIFAPAGMTETFYYEPGMDSPNMAHAYRPAAGKKAPLTFRSPDGKWDEYDYGEVDFFLTRADRGAYSSARDFMKFNKALYSGKLISGESLAQMITPYITTDIPMVDFGLGGAVRTEKGMPVKSYHMNNNGGFAILEGTWPEANLHYLVFSCRAQGDQRKLTMRLDSIIKSKGWI